MFMQYGFGSNFSPSLHIILYILYASSESSGETVCLYGAVS